MSLVDKIKSKSRDEWNALLKERLLWLRIYAQENGEKVFVLGLVLGMFVVFLFKIFVFTVALVALVYLIVMAIADSGTDGRGQAS